MSWAMGAVAAAALLFSCVPRVPDRVVPEFDPIAGEAAPGSGRVILDVENRRCRVRLASQHSTAAGAKIVQPHSPGGANVLCVTPCQVELPVGWHLLTFCDAGEVSVPVVRRTSVLRLQLRVGDTPIVSRWMLDGRP